MEVTREDVLRCAKLTQLSLTEDEIEPMRIAMTRLLTQAERLNELPLNEVDLTQEADGPVLPRRADEPHPGLTQAEALANAPSQMREQFAVPKVL